MSKDDVIHEIRRRNHGAPEHFLAAFPTQHLADYLHRLTVLHDAPAAGSPAMGFVRTCTGRAIVCRTR